MGVVPPVSGQCQCAGSLPKPVYVIKVGVCVVKAGGCASSKPVCVIKAGVRRDRPASARARNHREPVATRIRVLGRLVVARRAGKPWIAH